VLEAKLAELARLLGTSARVVFHTGAGLSTAAGIPDFRGPRGVWTLQKKGQAVEMRMRYEDAVPMRAHPHRGDGAQGVSRACRVAEW
jgi:mono-ADP-ribosyltransferase sirtuin 6